MIETYMHKSLGLVYINDNCRELDKREVIDGTERHVFHDGAYKVVTSFRLRGVTAYTGNVHVKSGIYEAVFISGVTEGSSKVLYYEVVKCAYEPLIGTRFQAVSQNGVYVSMMPDFAKASFVEMVSGSDVHEVERLFDFGDSCYEPYEPSIYNGDDCDEVSGD